jgi:hypothetical protein
MYHQETANLPSASAQIMMNTNADGVDTLITREPTPKMVSRRQWRRRRVRRGKT